MTDTVTVGQELQGQILDAVRKSQEMAIEAIKTWTDALQPMTSAMPPVTLPLADKLPKPEELVGSAYNFAEQLLASSAEVRGGRVPRDRTAHGGPGQEGQLTAEVTHERRGRNFRARRHHVCLLRRSALPATRRRTS